MVFDTLTAVECNKDRYYMQIIMQIALTDNSIPQV